MRVYSLLIFLIACTSDEGVKVHNSPPTITITSHSSGETFQEGYEVLFLAQAQDDNHETTELDVSWHSDVRTLCPA